MNNKRVLISVGQRFNRQLINYSLQRYPEVEIVGRSLNAIRIMSLIAQRKPHVWVHSFEEGPDYERISAYIRSIAPELAIVRIIPDDEFGYLLIPLRRIDDLVSHAMHFVDSDETLIASSSPT